MKPARRGQRLPSGVLGRRAPRPSQRTRPLHAPRRDAPVVAPVRQRGWGRMAAPDRRDLHSANDPNAKAKRLARASSRLVAYFRESGKRDRDGTEAALREEIKKSYEEYVEQIGREFAEGTTHFQDALNDVLAGGKKLF